MISPFIRSVYAVAIATVTYVDLTLAIADVTYSWMIYVWLSVKITSVVGCSLYNHLL